MMIPLIDVAALPEDATISDMRRLVDTKGYSRIPIFKDRIYNIIGMIESFDFLDAEGEYSSIKPYIRPILYLPESISAENALLIMQKERCSIAAAVNEYGGTEGIITVEDILEEIVGEIEDEYDMSKRYFKKVGENHYIIYARMEIDKLPELGIFIEEGDFETLGGFLLEKFGKIPQEGEIISYNGHSFKIRKATNRSIEEVEVKPLTQTESKSV
jgi:CBS domain containing-hemolysin-like protein